HGQGTRVFVMQTLSGFGPSGILFPDLPVLEGIDVTTPRAVPCPLLRVCVSRVNHLHNQMAVQAHRWFAVDIFRLHALSHDSTPLVICSCSSNSTAEERRSAKSTTPPRFYWTDVVLIG